MSSSTPLIDANITIPGLSMPIRLPVPYVSSFSTSFSVQGSFSEGAVVPAVTLIDAAGGISEEIAYYSQLSVDFTRPRINTVSIFSGADQTPLGLGNTLEIVVVWSEAVVLNTSTLSLPLSNGGVATFSGSDGELTVFTYTVGAGQDTAELDFESETVGALLTESFVDMAGNPANESYPSLSFASQGVSVDATRPYASQVVCGSPSGTYAPPNVLEFQVVFSEPINATSGLYLQLSNGGVASAAAGLNSAFSFQYTVGVDEATALLSVAMFDAASAEAAVDGAGNALAQAWDQADQQASLSACGYEITAGSGVQSPLVMKTSAAPVVYEPSRSPSSWTYTIEATQAPTSSVLITPMLSAVGTGEDPVLAATLAALIDVTPSDFLMPAGVLSNATFTITAKADNVVWTTEGTAITFALNHTITTTDPAFAGSSLSTTVQLFEDEVDTASIDFVAGSVIAEGASLDATLVLATQPGVPVDFACQVVPVAEFPDNGDSVPEVFVSPPLGTISPTSWSADGIALQLLASTDDTRWTESGEYPFTITCQLTSLGPYNGESLSLAMTFRDDDEVGLATLSSLSSGTTFMAVEEGSTNTYRVGLATRPLGITTITISASSDLISIFPSEVVFSASNWTDGALIEVVAPDDIIATARTYVTRTAQLTHTLRSADPAYSALAPVIETVSVTDNDVAGLTISKSFLDIFEAPDQGPTSATYTVALTSKPSAAVTITPRLIDLLTQITILNQASITPASFTIQPANWNVPVTIRISATRERIPEVSPMLFDLRHQSASTDQAYSTSNLGELRVAIRDEDTPVDNSPAPQLASAVLAETSETLIVTFTTFTDMAGKTMGTSMNCASSSVFNTATLAMLAGSSSATCLWTTNSTLQVSLPASHSVSTGATVTLKEGRLRRSLNGINFASGSVTVTGRLPVPQPSSASFSSSGAVITVVFSNPTTGLINGAPTGACKDLFIDASTLLGTTAVCNWPNPTTLRITLGAGASILPQPLISSSGTLCQGGRSLRPAAGAITASQGSVRSASACVDVVPPSPPPRVKASLVAAVGGRCNPCLPGCHLQHGRRRPPIEVCMVLHLHGTTCILSAFGCGCEECAAIHYSLRTFPWPG